MQKHGNLEKSDYLQIGGSNINIYSKNKGLCLVAGLLTIGLGVGGGGVGGSGGGEGGWRGS